MPGLPLSRASPLPHLNAFQSWNSVKCGSGLAREGAGTVTTYFAGTKKRPRPFDRGRFSFSLS
ncbi:hypothetical protein DYL59_10575 [Pseudomonas kairouanensis]|uniref:Uncharacterized protein n=1 Tax=Pseudomonas kairouanensis TaxID=2293832 RepID=A0A4Z0ASU6_9PSED|nr:hypothetical protein DYL59_10575 [Pseudomonas kairouanensis]